MIPSFSASDMAMVTFSDSAQAKRIHAIQCITAGNLVCTTQAGTNITLACTAGQIVNCALTHVKTASTGTFLAYYM